MCGERQQCGGTQCPRVPFCAAVPIPNSAGRSAPGGVPTQICSSLGVGLGPAGWFFRHRCSAASAVAAFTAAVLEGRMAGFGAPVANQAALLLTRHSLPLQRGRKNAQF